MNDECLRRTSRVLTAILKVAQPRILGIPESAESVIHHWDGAFDIPSGWVVVGVRDLSGPPEGTSRQHCDGGFWAFGVRPVFHAKRVVSGVPARPGEGPWPLELPEPVRDRENPVRQLHPRHARRGRSGAVAALF